MKRFVFFILFTWISLGYASNPIQELINHAGNASDYPKNDLLIIFDSTVTDVKETGLSYVWNHIVYKVLTPTGAKELATLTFGYDPMSAFVSIHKAVIYKKNGTIIALDTAQVMDYPAPARAIYWGAREIMIETGRLEPGDAVEVIMFKKGFTYALLMEEDDKYIPPMRGHFYDIIDFFGPHPINLKVYIVKVPENKPLQFEFYHGEARVSSWIEQKKFVYTFRKENILPIDTEPRMVALSDIAPKLLLSTSPDWYAKSLWFYKVNEDYGSFEYTPEIQEKVDEILVGAVDEMDSVSRLTHWCADEIRYSGISMGTGEGYTLHKGAMTFTDRCGVCKDKAGMLVTMLRAAGFESYPAMTMAGSRIDYIPADQFNHSVTLVRLRDGKYHLLDPTWVPYLRELWSSAEQQQQYLMGIPEGADLATTPISPPENHYVRITGNSTLLANGTLEGSLEVSAEGQSDGAIRRIFKYSNKTQWDANVKRELLQVHPRTEIISVEYPDPMNYLAGPIWIKIKYRIPDYAIIADGIVIFTPLIATPLFKSAQGHLYFSTNQEKRKYPFRDRCSRLVELSETIRLPEVGKIVRIPQSIDKQGEVASFHGGYVIQDNILTLRERASFGQRIYGAEDWPQFRAVVESQQQFADQPVIFELKNEL